MNERETLASLKARDAYGLDGSIHDADSEALIGLESRMTQIERDAFDAGWKAAKAYYEIHQ